LSGAPLLSVVAEWVQEARRQGLKKPINAGGGILRPSDVDRLLTAGASSVFVGTIAILRGWRLQGTIRHANRVFASVATRKLDSIRGISWPTTP
jgi:dihydroorotate dehydrogenase